MIVREHGRYRLLKKIDISDFDLNCPAEILSGILLFDHLHRKVLLLLKMVNVSEEILRSVYLSVNGLDDTGDPIPGVEPVHKSYLDLKAKPLGIFGTNQPIALDPRVRNIEITMVKIGKGQVAWRNSVDEALMYHPQPQTSIAQLGNELGSFFKTLVDQKGFPRKTWLRYVSQTRENSWICSCGRPNPNSAEACVRCGIERDWIFTNTRVDILTKKLNDVNDAKRYAEEMRQAKQSATWQTWKRRSPYIAAALLVIAITGFLFVENNNKKILYANTISAFEKGEYDLAQSGFTLLGKFKDSQELLEQSIKEPVYNNMLTHYQAKNYEKASQFLVQLGDYKDSAAIKETIVKEQAYAQGTALLGNSKFEEAEAIFSGLGDFKDSVQKLEMARVKFVAPLPFQNALIALQSGNIDQSLKDISSLDPFNNPEVSKEWYLEYGKTLYSNGYFLEALPYFEQVKGQVDVGSYLNSNPYQMQGKWKYERMTLTLKLKEKGIITIFSNQSPTPFVDRDYQWDPASTNSFASLYERWLITNVDSKALKLTKQVIDSSGKLVEEPLELIFLEPLK